MDISRREFLGQMAMGAVGIMSVTALGKNTEQQAGRNGRMPVLFVGHGSPMNAIEDSAFSRAWVEEAKQIPHPKAILCISAHWEADGLFVSTALKPETIYDFYGFPDELYKVVYSAPGAPEWADTVRRMVTGAEVKVNRARGLDHGAWVVLRRMFPAADIPTFQMSLDMGRTPQSHYDLARQLMPLRDQGVLIIGSGNMVHNLRMLTWTESAYDWAVEFDKTLAKLIENRDHKALINYPALGPSAKLAIPTNEHYLPMLCALALQQPDEPLRFFAEKVLLGSISMRGFRIG